MILLTREGMIKRQTVTRVGDNIENKLWFMAGGNESGSATLENSLEILQNVKYRVNIWLSNFTYLRKKETHPYAKTCPQMFSIIHNS